MENNICKAREILDWLRVTVPGTNCDDAEYLARAIETN